MPSSDEDEPPIKKRSGASRVMAPVTFVNLTDRTVDVIWINYEGQRVRLKTLRPKDEVPVNTYVGHPWLFRDTLTGDKLVVEFKEVFSSETPDESAPNSPPRRLFNITIPVYSLRERCIQVVRKLCSRDDIPTLGLPTHLVTDLLALPS